MLLACKLVRYISQAIKILYPLNHYKMRLKPCFLLFLLLCFSVTSYAQQVPPEVEQLRAGIAEAKQLLSQVKQQQERLRSLHATLQDSAALKAALDSLQQKYTEPRELKQQEDSLKLAFANHQAALAKLDEAALKLQEEITRATEVLARELLPKDATQALQQLKQASQRSAKSLLPDEGLHSQLPPELPAPKELQAWPGHAP